MQLQPLSFPEIFVCAGKFKYFITDESWLNFSLPQAQCSNGQYTPWLLVCLWWPMPIRKLCPSGKSNVPCRSEIQFPLSCMKGFYYLKWVRKVAESYASSPPSPHSCSSLALQYDLIQWNEPYWSLCWACGQAIVHVNSVLQSMAEEWALISNNI